MAKRVVPGLDLTAYWPLGDDTYKDELDADLFALSILGQLVAEEFVSGEPAGVQGKIVLTEDSDQIGIYEAGSWKYITAKEGWRAWVIDPGALYVFDGVDTWVEVTSGGGGSGLPAGGTPGQVLVKTGGGDGDAGWDSINGESAYEIAVAEGFVGTVDAWLASLEGPPGDDSTVPGPPGEDGLGVPAGGTTGQVLTKVSDDDNDTEWADGGGGGGADYPAGGDTGQLLAKASGADNDVEWVDPPEDTGEVASISRIYNATSYGNQYSNDAYCANGNFMRLISALKVSGLTGRVDAVAGRSYVGQIVEYDVSDGEITAIIAESVEVTAAFTGNWAVPLSFGDVIDLAPGLYGLLIVRTDGSGTDALRMSFATMIGYDGIDAIHLGTLAYNVNLPIVGSAATVYNAQEPGYYVGFIIEEEVGDPLNVRESMMLAVSDENTTITSGVGKLTFRMPYAFDVEEVRASLKSSSSDGPVVVDINVSGASMLSTKLSIDEGEKTSLSAATAAVISDSTIADDAEITIDIDDAGDDATGLKVTFIGRKL